MTRAITSIPEPNAAPCRGRRFPARSAFESFARLFKGGRVQGRSPCPRSAERGTLFMLTKDQEGGLRGKPYQGVSPLYLFLRFVRVRRYAGRGSLPCPAFRPHFFGACPKKRGGTGSRGERLPPSVTAHTYQPPPPSRAKMTPVHRGRSAHADGGATGVKKALFFGGSTPFLWASTKEMGSKGRTSHRPPPKVSAHTYKAKNKKGETP